jgi:hypothetical protein
VRHCGEITLPGLYLLQREWSQDRAKLSFFSQDKFVSFYRLPQPLSREKLFNSQPCVVAKPELLPALTPGQELPYSGVNWTILAGHSH